VLSARRPLLELLEMPEEMDTTPDGVEESPDDISTLPLEPAELEPDEKLSPPLLPDEAAPVTTMALPLEPLPDTALDCIIRAPEPAALPAPVDKLMSPPAPLAEELEPAEITTAPPSLVAEGPTIRERLPDGPPEDPPVETTTAPDAPLLAGPLPMAKLPLAPAPALPDSTATEPEGPEAAAPV
jgi:hypothetical protein